MSTENLTPKTNSTLLSESIAESVTTENTGNSQDDNHATHKSGRVIHDISKTALINGLIGYGATILMNMIINFWHGVTYGERTFVEKAEVFGGGFIDTTAIIYPSLLQVFLKSLQPAGWQLSLIAVCVILGIAGPLLSLMFKHSLDNASETEKRLRAVSDEIDLREYHQRPTVGETDSPRDRLKEKYKDAQLELEIAMISNERNPLRISELKANMVNIASQISTIDNNISIIAELKKERQELRKVYAMEKQQAKLDKSK